MRPIILRSSLLIAIVFLSALGTMAQRVITGTVYMGGKPAAGFTVEAQRGSSMMTSFDGKYKVNGDAKTKWLKVTEMATSTEKKYDLTGDSLDIYFDDVKPAEEKTGGVNNQSLDELLKENNSDFLSTWTLYETPRRQGDFKSALPYWQKLYKNYPKARRSIYINGVEMQDTLISRATTPQEKQEHFRKMMDIYDQRIKNFGEKGFVLGRKGISWFDYYRKDEDLSLDQRKQILKKGYDWMNESVKEQGAKSETAVLVLLLNTSSQLFKLGELPKDTVVQDYDICNKILNEKIKGDDKDAAQRAERAVPFVERIFEKSGAADCDALIKIYTPQFEQNSENAEFIKNMLRHLTDADCKESDLFSQASIKLYSLEPSPEAAVNLAVSFMKKGDFDKAKEYFKQAMDQETDKDRLSTYYYQYAYLLYANDKNYPEAREYARKALAINPKYCDALYLVGLIYEAASQDFSKDNFEKATVFWVAVDYFKKAAAAGEDCEVKASQEAEKDKAYFPKKDDGFFHGLTEGQNYKVGGWINETTKVRYN